MKRHSYFGTILLILLISAILIQIYLSSNRVSSFQGLINKSLLEKNVDDESKVHALLDAINENRSNFCVSQTCVDHYSPFSWVDESVSFSDSQAFEKKVMNEIIYKFVELIRVYDAKASGNKKYLFKCIGMFDILVCRHTREVIIFTYHLDVEGNHFHTIAFQYNFVPTDDNGPFSYKLGDISFIPAVQK